MVYPTPTLKSEELAVLSLIDELRGRLSDRVREPRRWSGGLRRVTFARAVQASNSIEGYNATLDDAVAAVDGEELLDADTETRLAIVGYRDAMTYVLQLAQDDGANVDETLIKSLHFMMLRHDLAKYPGRWRPGSIFVRREPAGEIVYEGPEHALVPRLIAEMLDELHECDAPVLVKAAMAHLNLVMIHPFKDGNGRMARCLQTLVLAKEQVVAPVFSSIEEYLGRNTQAYYDVLAEVGQGSWRPERDPRPWVRFCLTAHYRQARTTLRRTEETEELWRVCARLAEEHRLQERTVAGLIDAAIGLRLRNSSYRQTVEVGDGAEISDLTATRDLKHLVDAGLFEAVGERRGRYYIASNSLRREWAEIRNRRTPRDDDDPFRIVADAAALDAAARAAEQRT
jgi:Fic family protein